MHPFGVQSQSQNRVIVDFDFKILTALKGWVGQAAKRTGALHKKTSLKKAAFNLSKRFYSPVQPARRDFDLKICPIDPRGEILT
jgi:hypothetical protein